MEQQSCKEERLDEERIKQYVWTKEEVLIPKQLSFNVRIT